MTSSWLSIQLISESTLVNSVACAAGERRVGAERRPDLEDLAEAGRLRHLLEELRALREVGLGVEVLHLEQLGAGLARAGHELRGVQLDEVVLDPVRAQRVLERGLDAEDQVRAWAGAGRGSASPCACRGWSPPAIGVSGIAAVTTSRDASLISMPPSLTRSSCLSSPVTVTKLPWDEAGDGGGRLVVDDDTLGIRGARVARAAPRRTRRAARRTAPSSGRGRSRPIRTRKRGRRRGRQGS